MICYNNACYDRKRLTISHKGNCDTDQECLTDARRASTSAKAQTWEMTYAGHQGDYWKCQAQWEQIHVDLALQRFA